MAALFIIVVSLCIATLLKFTFTLLSSIYPPQQPPIPIYGNFLWLWNPISDLEFILRRLLPRYDPLIAIKIARRSLIFVGSHSLALEALIQNDAVFAHRRSPNSSTSPKKQSVLPPTAPPGASATISPRKSFTPPTSAATPPPANGCFLFSSTASEILLDLNRR
ncbi:hypothetical protein ACS0TY_005378 [Phlomoides rotata]